MSSMEHLISGNSSAGAINQQNTQGPAQKTNQYIWRFKKCHNTLNIDGFYLYMIWFHKPLDSQGGKII